MKSRLVLLASVPLLLASLVACASSTPSAPHSPSALARCTPTTATIQWSLSDAEDNNTVPALVTVYQRDGSGGTTFSSHTVAPKVDVQLDEADLPFFSHTSEARWDKALLASVKLTGQVPTDFGTTPKLSPVNTGPASGRGSYLEVDAQQLVRVPFTISCEGEKQTIAGSVVGPFNGSMMTVYVGCTQKPAKDDGQETLAGIALAAKYCATT